MSQNPFGEQVPPPLPPQYYGSPYGQGSTISALAIVSLVLACAAVPLTCVCMLAFPLPFFAVILGHLAIIEIRRSQGRVTGMGIAIAGLVIGYILLLVFLVYFGILVFQFVPAGRANFRWR